MPPRKFRDRRTCVFVGTELSPPITKEIIQEINKNAVSITRRAFFNNIDPGVLKYLHNAYKFDIRRHVAEDAGMTFIKSNYQGRLCYCARWLGLLWVFGPKE